MEWQLRNLAQELQDRAVDFTVLADCNEKAEMVSASRYWSERARVYLQVAHTLREIATGLAAQRARVPKDVLKS